MTCFELNGSQVVADDGHPHLLAALRDELKTILAELTYDKLATQDSEMQDAAEKVLSNVPTGIYVG